MAGEQKNMQRVVMFELDQNDFCGRQAALVDVFLRSGRVWCVAVPAVPPSRSLFQ